MKSRPEGESPLVLVAAYGPQSFWNLPEDAMRRLESSFPGVRWVREEHPREGSGPALPGAEVFFGWHLPPEDFAAATALRWIHSPATGVRRLLYPLIRSSEVAVTSSRSAHAPFLAEQVMAWILAHVRRLRPEEQGRERRHWIQEELLEEAPPDTLLGKTLVIVGYGSAGRELAARARPFGVRILAVKRRPSAGDEGADELVGVEGTERFLARADFVVNLLPYTGETAGFFDRGRLEAIRPGSFFVNVGRGKTVDEGALADCLRRGHLAGAGLDVFAREPLDSASPLWDAPGTWISPHVAGAARGALWERLVDLFAGNLRRYLDGKPLRNLVDKEAGY